MISYPQAPENARADDLSIKAISRVTNNIMRGKTNNRGEVTLTAASATTVVPDVNVGGDSFIIFMPTTANAAIELGNSTMYVSSTGKQTFTITHDNNAQVDRTFRYVVFG